jgi:glycogen(starch) synthase
MRLLLVSNLYPPQELGGYGRSLADFAWGLMQRGHQVEVLSSDAPYLGPSGLGPSGERVWRQLKLKGSFAGGVTLLNDWQACALHDAENSAAVRDRVRQGHYQGILLGNLDLLGAELLPTLLEPGVPVLHHVGFMAAPYEARHWPRMSHYHVVAASQAVRRSLQSAGWPVADCPVVYPGARVELFAADHWQTWRGLQAGRPHNPLKVCFAGLLMGSKGAHTLVQAAAKLHRSGLSIQVNLAGAEFQPHYWQHLQQLAAAEGVADHLRWVGPLDRARLARFLQLHQVGVFPSTYPEAFGIVGAEMQANGLALVSSGAGGAQELFEHGESGLAFEPGNADDLSRQLARLVNEPGLQQTLQVNGQQRVREKFSVSAAAAQLERLFER